jgi:hypothetical protein
MLKLLSSNKKNNTKCLKNSTEEEKKQKPIYSFYKKCESVQSVQNVEKLENIIINKVNDADADVKVYAYADTYTSMNKNLDEKVDNMFDHCPIMLIHKPQVTPPVSCNRRGAGTRKKR